MSKVVIDTNVIIDALKDNNATAQRIFNMARNSQLRPLMSIQLQSEYNVTNAKLAIRALENKFENGTLQKVDFKDIEKSFNRTSDQLFKTFFDKCDFVVTSSKTNLSADRDDNKVINLAIDGNAKFIITNNIKDFMNLRDPENPVFNSDGNVIRVMRPTEFVDYYEKNEKQFATEMVKIKIADRFRSVVGSAKLSDKETYTLHQASRIARFSSIRELRQAIDVQSLKLESVSYKIKDVKELRHTFERIKDLASNFEDNKNSLKFHGINSMADIESKSLVLEDAERIMPELQQEFDGYQKNLNVLSDALETLSKCAKDHVREIGFDFER